MEVKIKVPNHLSEIPLHKYQQFQKVLDVNQDSGMSDVFIQDVFLQHLPVLSQIDQNGTRLLQLSLRSARVPSLKLSAGLGNITKELHPKCK